MSSADWPRCQGGTPNRYSGSARAISQVNALATQMSTTAIQRPVARMAHSRRKATRERAHGCVATVSLTPSAGMLLSLAKASLIITKTRETRNQTERDTKTQGYSL